MVSLGGSNVNRNKLYVALLVLAGLIVTPLSVIVNFNHKVNIAEGNPIPPPVRPPLLVAEGNPIPPPVRPPVMVAEGNPIPPPVRPPVAAFIV
jgi:hypothetical protein